MPCRSTAMTKGYNMNDTLFDAVSKDAVIVGVDEAGRGPLAGRVYAAAVILGEGGLSINGLNDSKQLSAAKRDKLFDEIVGKAAAFGIGYADEKEIDEINILQATFLAMRRAVEQIAMHYDYIKVDGNKYPFDSPGEAVVKGDAKVKEIMAASILAKVSRDRYMLDMAKLYPQYEFEKHKGYGSARHIELLQKYGPSPIHRLTFGKVRELVK